jgi:hypothetical protein
MSIDTFVPINKNMVAGTTIGASRVSSRIKVRLSALSPLKIKTQIKPDTAVGPARRRTNPAIISGLEKTSEDEKRAATGIIIWPVTKKSKIKKGFRTAAFNSPDVNLSAPENVIIPKRKITNGRRFIKTSGKKKPSATAKGVVTGISFDSQLFK